jgi:histone deacetylase 6
MKAEFIGKNKGKYKNINIAWETGLIVDEENRDNNIRSDLGSQEYRMACDSFLFPVVEEFKPDLIIVSCGFDGAIHDHLGWSNLSAMVYAYMTKRLVDICDRVLVVQEGGYNVELLG